MGKKPTVDAETRPFGRGDGPMENSKSDDQYSEQETQRRLEKALRGAFNTPATPLKSIPPKRPKTQRKRRSKAGAASS